MKTINGIKKLYSDNRIHIEIAYGKHKECIQYIKGPYDKGDKHKDANEQIHEIGTEPLECGEQTKRRWTETYEDIRENKKLEEIRHPHIYLNYKTKILEKICEDEHGQDLEEPCGMLICGEAGTGKTTTAKQQAQDEQIYMKDATVWWDKYMGQETVILDDLHPRDVPTLITCLKKWTDKYVFLAQVKGGYMIIRPKKFIITTQYKMSELFTIDKDRQAMERRLDLIHMRKENNKTIISTKPKPEDNKEWREVEEEEWKESYT